ncbi:hypothetical protein [Paenibacillus sp. LPE1-1-1.1]
MDKSISVEPTMNRAVFTLVKIETLAYFVAPVQPVTERKEVR